jgi:hypothetical protein
MRSGLEFVMLERGPFICTPQRIWARSLLSGALIFAGNGCGGERKPIQTHPLSTAAAPTLQYGSQDVLAGSFIVEPGKYKTFAVTVTAAMKNPSVEGNFKATGGDNDIEVLVLEEGQYLNWQNGHKFDATYNSGRVAAGKPKMQLPQSGTYYLVFSNCFSDITNKAVVADVKLQYFANRVY